MVLGSRTANVHFRLGCSGPRTFVTILLRNRPSGLSGSPRGLPSGLARGRRTAVRGQSYSACLEYLFPKFPGIKHVYTFLGGKKFHFCCQLVLLENSFSQHQHVGRPALSSID